MISISLAFICVYRRDVLYSSLFFANVNLSVDFENKDIHNKGMYFLYKAYLPQITDTS